MDGSWGGGANLFRIRFCSAARRHFHDESSRPGAPSAYTVKGASPKDCDYPRVRRHALTRMVDSHWSRQPLGIARGLD